MPGARSLDQAQLGLGDMGIEEFRRVGHQVVDDVADYLARLEELPVLPRIRPGDVRARLPEVPPRSPEPIARILDDHRELIVPNVTQWQHPGFMAFFPATASAPGILGEWLAAALNSNVMLWRNAPASTELEEVVVSWLRQMLGLPACFDGMLTDTASISTLTSIIAARHAAPGLDVRERGLAGRGELGALRLYCSTEAHSSVEKAAIVAGIGRQGVRRIPVDGDYRLRPEELARAITSDRGSGHVPFCVVSTLGTTSSTSVDPAAEVARIAEGEGLWHHVDAAYAGAAALLEEKRPLFAGWERADSIVVNPHKWMFTPLDASLLLFRRPEVYTSALSLVPEYLRTTRQGEAHDYHEYGIQLGRRFRALKLWFIIRYFGSEGMAARIREHCRLAATLAERIGAHPDWELLSPVPFATVCFRHRPASLGARLGPDVEARLDRMNEAILEAVNRSGRVMLSHTRLAGRFTIRVSLGNLRAGAEHVDRCWAELSEAAASVAAHQRPVANET
jgi:aromatic-L-amino-acid decarboxylase